jgi:hypothetical protein
MTAGILHQHGVMVGKHLAKTKFNPKGHFENSEMKQYLERLMVNSGVPLNPVNGPIPCPDVPGDFAESLRKCVGVKTGLWLLKEHKLLWFWPRLREVFPDSIWILTHRPKQDVVRSMIQHPAISSRIKSAIQCGQTMEGGASRYWSECIKRQREIAKHDRHVWIDTDKIARGNMNESRQLVEACGLEFDAGKVRAFVNREYWHA